MSFIRLRIRGEGGVDRMEEDGEEKMEAWRGDNVKCRSGGVDG